MQLRPYQTELVQAARREFAAGKRRVILQMATGGGKTPVGCSIIQSAAAKGHEVWMGCHKNFLVEQASEKLKQFDVYHGVVSSSSKYNARQKVHVCGLGVLKNRMHNMRPPSIFVWDECHHIGARTWVEIMEAFPNTFHLGLTANPPLWNRPWTVVRLADCRSIGGRSDRMGEAASGRGSLRLPAVQRQELRVCRGTSFARRRLRSGGAWRAYGHKSHHRRRGGRVQEARQRP